MSFIVRSLVTEVTPNLRVHSAKLFLNKAGQTTRIGISSNYTRYIHTSQIQSAQRKFKFNPAKRNKNLNPQDLQQRQRATTGKFDDEEEAKVRTLKAKTGASRTEVFFGLAQLGVVGLLVYRYYLVKKDTEEDEDADDERYYKEKDRLLKASEDGRANNDEQYDDVTRSSGLGSRVIKNDDGKDDEGKQKLIEEMTSEEVEHMKQLELLEKENELIPDEKMDTYELGMFSTSQKQKEAKRKEKRDERLHKRNFLFRIYFRLHYLTLDYIIEPFLMIERIGELTILFLPLVVIYPITWFGKMNSHKNNERSGSLLYYKLLTFVVRHGGASFIKLGQWAASRTDIFPEELCKELSRLHSDAKPHSFRQTKKILEKSFKGLKMEDIFEEFPHEPIGCGAIAQVYLAKLNKRFFPKFADKWVAVKVIHPRVERIVERDLKIMEFFANLIDYIPTMEWLSLPQEVEQFSILMKLQLDLRIEGYNLIKFQKNFENRPEIKFPSPLMEVTNRDVLIEEKINGLPMGTVLRLKKNSGKSVFKDASDILIDSFLQMLILDNFIHADLHPGNIFVRFSKYDESNRKVKKTISDPEEDENIVDRLKSLKSDEEILNELSSLHEKGYKPQVCFIDTGLVTELNEKNRYNFIELFNALAEFDGYKAGELMIERSRTPETAIDKELFAFKVERLVDRIKERTFTLGSVSIGDLLDRMLGMVRNHHVRMEGDFVTVIVAILLLEGIAKQLDPDLDLFASSIPILRQLGLKDGKLLFHDHNTLSMIKVWATLEVRQFISASVNDVYYLVKSDGLCPNY